MIDSEIIAYIRVALIDDSLLDPLATNDSMTETKPRDNAKTYGQQVALNALLGLLRLNKDLWPIVVQYAQQSMIKPPTHESNGHNGDRMSAFLAPKE